MPEEDPETEAVAQKTRALRREIRILERKLKRSGESRVALEEAKDRSDSLYRHVLGATEEQKLLLDEKNRMLESLSSKLSKYLAPQVYESIFSGRQGVSLETKRKKLTVFFSDLKNFTQITDDLEPEDLSDLLNDYLTEMAGIALEYGATIDKFIGDAMLMFFGDPETKGAEEDAAACVAMAIAMQRRMSELQRTWRSRGIQQPLRMRIGINTGYCNVGNFGSADRMDYTIIGGEVNLAARLEEHADPDGILLSYETYALVRGHVTAEQWPPIEAKGIRREIRPYALTDFLDDPDQENTIRSEIEGMSLRINLRNLDDERRHEMLTQLALISERRATERTATTRRDDGPLIPAELWEPSLRRLGPASSACSSGSDGAATPEPTATPETTTNCPFGFRTAPAGRQTQDLSCVDLRGADLSNADLVVEVGPLQLGNSAPKPPKTGRGACQTHFA